MRIFSAIRNSRPLDRTAAWASLLTNQLVAPGLGTLMAGHLIEGTAQIVAAVSGFVLVLVWFAHFFKALQDLADLNSALGAFGWQLKLGAALFLGSWFWALGSGIRIVRRSRGSPPVLDAGQ